LIYKTGAVVAVVLAAGVAMTGPAQAQSRDQIRIVGSSTVFPFTTAVAETFGRNSAFKTPVVESTGTGGGMKLFCSGVGPQHPDLTNASRRIKKSEFDTCGANGVTAITELKIGFDGIVLASAKGGKPLALTREQIWLGLAEQVPVDGKLAANPYQKWSDIDKSLPAVEIEVLGPPPTSGTRDAFVELVMDEGCKAFKEIKALPEKDQKKACQQIREDGAFVEAGENDNLIVQKLAANKTAVGIFGYSFLDQNGDKLQAAKIAGVAPTFEAIAEGKYPVSRALYVYVKTAHVGVIPGIKEFIAEYTSDRAFGADGYLSDKGLIPLPEKDRLSVRSVANNLLPLTM